LRKEGKRVIRDVEGMGIAGGWYILGIGWILEMEVERGRQKVVALVPKLIQEGGSWNDENEDEKGEEGDVIVFKGKKKNVREIPQQPSVVDMVESIDEGSKTTESTVIKTPGTVDRIEYSSGMSGSSEFERLKLLVSIYQAVFYAAPALT
jgi:hypothetical protein